MKDGTLYFGMVAVFVLLMLGIAIYTWSNFQAPWGDLDLIGVAGLITLYIVLGQDRSLQPKRVGAEPPR